MVSSLAEKNLEPRDEFQMPTRQPRPVWGRRTLLIRLLVLISALLAISERAVGLPGQIPFSNPEHDASRTLQRATSAADYRVRSLPGLPKRIFSRYESHSGLIEVDKASKGALFFWLVSRRNKRHKFSERRVLKLKDVPKPRPLILWLQGGPGCSSMGGLFTEHGPFRVVSSPESVNGTSKRDKPKVRHNWPNWVNDVGDILYIDQPVGTGYSTVDSDANLTRDELAMGQTLVDFLVKFFNLFPHLREAEFHIAGESYGGQYVPYAASAILEHNKATSTPINLRGIAIGNGKTDPNALYTSLVPFADLRGVLKPSSEHRAKALKHLDTCLEEQRHTLLILRDSCEKVLSHVMEGSKEVYGPCGANVYDLRIVDSSAYCSLEWPRGTRAFQRYMIRPDVVAALNVGKSKREPVWDLCNGHVGAVLNNETVPPSSTLMQGIAEAGIRTLVYAGSEDLLCNWLGQEWAVGNLTWNGATGFTSASRKVPFLLRNGMKAGTAREERNLSLVTIEGASHLAPFDKPEASAEMMARFVGYLSIGDEATEVDDVEVKEVVEAWRFGHWQAWLGALFIVTILVLGMTRI
jgi:carboxypeptidase D